MDVVSILSVSGPLPVEDLVWRAGGAPHGALVEIADMADSGLLRLRGITTQDLRELARQVTGEAGNADAALEQVHSRLGNTEPLAELTREGLRSAPAFS